MQREIPGPDWRLWPEQIRNTEWAEIFEIPAESALRLTVDVGFGSGEFIIDLALRDPGGAFLGIEQSFKRVFKVARRLSETEIRNVRLFCAEAQWVVRESFADASVAAFWVNFPDPWPKRRHNRRRLIEPVFVRELAHRLEPGGSLHIATDHTEYAEVIESALTGERALENAHAPDRYRVERPETIPTAFEQEWRGKGSSCFFYHHRRSTGGGPRDLRALDTGGRAS